MSNPHEPDAETHSRDNSGGHWWGRVIERAKAYQQQRHARKKQETPTERHTRRMAYATVAMAVFAAVSVGVSYLQWKALRQQIGDIESTSSDTHNIALATKHFADAMKIQADNTGGLVDQATRSAKASQSYATSANGQLIEMREQQRPIIDIVSIVTLSPLIFNDTGAHIRVNINLRNSGRTLARYVYGDLRFFLKQKDYTDQELEIAICKNLSSRPLGTKGHGFNVPGDSTQPYTMNATLDARDLANWKARYVANRPEPVVPMLVGCFDYPYEGKHSQIGLIAEIDRTGSADPTYPFTPIDPSAGDVPAAQILLGINPGIVPYVNQGNR